MKKILLTLILSTFASSVFAISFITEQDVKIHLQADKVIEINKLFVQTIENNDCTENALFSRSGRTYIVKIGYDAFLFATPSGLTKLKECRKL